MMAPQLNIFAKYLCVIVMDEEKVCSAIKSHNEYKADIAEAELVESGEEELKVKFEGNFSLSCCMDEYFIDLVYQLEDEGIEVEFKDFQQVGEKSFVAEYEVK